MYLVILDVLFHILHLFVIIVNVFFWIHPKTRKIHLIVFSLTSFSWIVIGYFYGWGYCFLTDWHWQIKERLGQSLLPNSYITYLTNNIMGLSLADSTVQYYTMLIFVLVLLISSVTHIKDFLKRH